MCYDRTEELSSDAFIHSEGKTSYPANYTKYYSPRTLLLIVATFAGLRTLIMTTEIKETF